MPIVEPTGPTLEPVLESSFVTGGSKMYVFYKPLTESIGRIESIMPEEGLTEEQKAKGIQIDALPVFEERPGHVAILYINLTTHEIFIEYTSMSGPEESIFVLKSRLQETEVKLKTATQAYLEADIRSISLNDLKALKIAELKEKCNQTIETKFVSPSTGFTFGFKVHDQSNMANQSILFLADPSMTECQWKTEDAGVQSFTRDQFLKILPEGNNHVRANVAKFWTLVAHVQNATDKDHVQGVQWQ